MLAINTLTPASPVHYYSALYSKLVRLATGTSVMPVLSTASWTTSMRESVVMSRCSFQESEAGIVVHHSDQVVVAPSDDLEVGGIGSPHLVRASGLAVVLLGGLQLHLR